MTIEIPSVTNYVKIKSYGQELQVHISKLTDSDVEHIVKNWGVKFKRHVAEAKERERRACTTFNEIKNLRG